MIDTRPLRVLRAACVLSLVALGLMAWSLLDPRPIPVILAMSAGQVLGTMALAAFLFVVVAELRTPRARSEKRGAPPPASGG